MGSVSMTRPITTFLPASQAAAWESENIIPARQDPTVLHVALNLYLVAFERSHISRPGPTQAELAGPPRPGPHSWLPARPGPAEWCFVAAATAPVCRLSAGRPDES